MTSQTRIPKMRIPKTHVPTAMIAPTPAKTAQTTMTYPPLTLADVQAAAQRIAGAVVRTPTLYSRTLSDMLGADLWLKFENLQFTAAYKERGALNALLLMKDSLRQRGVIAASAGNHSQALAYHAARLGIPATVVMPKTTPQVKISQTASHGAEIILFGEKYDDSYIHACAIGEERGLTFVHPFDDPHIAAGQGTVALEMLEDAPAIDMLVIPIGGGGLFTGMGTAARALKPDIGLVGVQAELYPSMYAQLQGRTMPCEGDTLAEGIAVKKPGSYTSAMVAALHDDILLVSERDLEQAVSLLLQVEKTVVEGAGAAGLAALLAYEKTFAGRTIGLVLCGGNIDTRLLANVLLRTLARSGQLARLRLRLQDRPGALFKVMKIFEEQQVNIIEIYHQRIFTTLPAKGLITDIECETRDGVHLEGLVVALRTAGYRVTPVDLA